MKKLPSIYKNNINKNISNNKTSCNINLNRTNKTVQDEINDIFNGFGYSYNIPLEIITTQKTYNTSLIAKVNNYVVTTNNDVILIDDIIEIKKKKVQ